MVGVYGLACSEQATMNKPAPEMMDMRFRTASVHFMASSFGKAEGR
jgi:hypothetical protein